MLDGYKTQIHTLEIYKLFIWSLNIECDIFCGINEFMAGNKCC